LQLSNSGTTLFINSILAVAATNLVPRSVIDSLILCSSLYIPSMFSANSTSIRLLHPASQAKKLSKTNEVHILGKVRSNWGILLSLSHRLFREIQTSAS